MRVAISSYCGLKCEECAYKESAGCKGCIASQGHPFYGDCKLAECVKGKKIRFCGECPEIPCELLKEYSYDVKQGDNGARIAHCNEIKSVLVTEAREGTDPISVCGHHCDYCFMGKWCGGCRSGYNCCSYATLFEDGICPQVACAKSKHLDGCYECEELIECKIGYYAKEYGEGKKEYAAKSAALFIKRHGKECYAKTLKKTIDAGESYPGFLDQMGSVEKALEKLESFL